MVKESFFHQHFERGSQAKLQSCHWLQLRAANGLTIPYINYVELIVELCSKIKPRYGALVVKDPQVGFLSSLVSWGCSLMHDVTETSLGSMSYSTCPWFLRHQYASCRHCTCHQASVKHHPPEAR